MDFKDFVSDAETVDAVIRNITVIGAAANHIPEQFVKSNPEIPWREIADMRNIVVHEYFGVNEKIIWDTIQKDLPQILPILRDIVQKNKCAAPKSHFESGNRIWTTKCGFLLPAKQARPLIYDPLQSMYLFS